MHFLINIIKLEGVPGKCASDVGVQCDDLVACDLKLSSFFCIDYLSYRKSSSESACYDE